MVLYLTVCSRLAAEWCVCVVRLADSSPYQRSKKPNENVRSTKRTIGMPNTPTAGCQCWKINSWKEHFPLPLHSHCQWIIRTIWGLSALIMASLLMGDSVLVCRCLSHRILRQLLWYVRRPVESLGCEMISSNGISNWHAYICCYASIGTTMTKGLPCCVESE